MRDYKLILITFGSLALLSISLLGFDLPEPPAHGSGNLNVAEALGGVMYLATRVRWSHVFFHFPKITPIIQNSEMNGGILLGIFKLHLDTPLVFK